MSNAQKRTRTSKKPQLLRGFKDILPEDAGYWRVIRDSAEKILDAYGYGSLQPPLVEQTSLFRRSIGEHTDIVSKEMFTFTDKSNESMTLRPELTAGIARAYIEHGMINRTQPVKVYSIGPAFRYDRPQAGRYRQFHQLDIESIGNDKPAADAEIIFLAYLICSELGLDVQIKINSLGSLEARVEYIKLLKDYLKSKRRLLCDEDKQRLTKNPLRILDSKDPAARDLIQDAPQLIDHLDEASKDHFVAVLEHLGESGVPYELDPFIVRGLDYYNRTAFEIVSSTPPAEGEQPLAIGGGGRYDGLIEQLGGRPTPAVGMAFGLERMIELARTSGKALPKGRQPQLFLAQLGEEASKHAFGLFEVLRKANIRVRANFSKDGLKAQLEQADKLGVPYCIILGQKELLDKTIIIRDMENGMQEVVDVRKVVDEVKKRLKK